MGKMTRATESVGAKAEVTSGFVSMFRHAQHNAGSTNLGVGKSLSLSESVERFGARRVWRGSQGRLQDQLVCNCQSKTKILPNGNVSPRMFLSPLPLGEG